MGAPVPVDGPDELLPPLGVPVWAPFLAALVAVVGLLGVSIVVGIVVGIGGGDNADLDSDGFLIGLTLAQDVLLVVSAIGVVWWLAGRPVPAAFGLRLPEWRSALGWAAAGLWRVLGRRDHRGARARRAGGPGARHRPQGAGLARGADRLRGADCVIAPLTEEFVFRGFLFRVLWERTNVIFGIVASAALFGLVHKPERRLDQRACSWCARCPLVSRFRPHGVFGAVHHASRIPQLDLVRRR